MTQSEVPLVSVIMPVYNAGRYLRPAIESVLGQTHANLELIIVDDGSTDGCMETVTDLLVDPRVRVMRQANAGKPVAMNRALDVARGEFYAINDADDISHPDRLEKLVAVMQANPDVAAVFSGYELIIDDRRIAPVAVAKNTTACRQDIDSFQMPSHDPTALWRVESTRPFRYSEHLPIVEGFDYILRVGERCPMLVVGQVLYQYRIHRESVTRKNPSKRHQYVVRLLQEACERRSLDFDMRFPHVKQNTCPDEDNNVAGHFVESVAQLRERGQWTASVRTALFWLNVRSKRLQDWKPLVCALLPVAMIRVLRRRRKR